MARPTTHIVEDSSQKYLPFIVMEDLFEKLKLLDYFKDFPRLFRNVQPINKHYFAMKSNPDEQVYTFVCISAWLVRKSGLPFDLPRRDDDFRAVITQILYVLGQMGIEEDYSQVRLQQGWGEQVINVVDALADAALEQVGIAWNPDGDQAMDEVEQPVLVPPDDLFDLENGEPQDDCRNPILQMLKNIPITQYPLKPPIVSDTNADEWKLEVERLLPQLKITLRPDPKDWRSHLGQIHKYKDEMDASLTATKGQLEALYNNIGQTLDKLAKRERYINSQVEGLLEELKSTQEELTKVKEQYKDVSGGVTERSRILASISQEVEDVKHELDERGTSMTDGTPLIHIKKSLQKLKTEVAQLDVRIGVAVNTLLKAKLRERGHFTNAVNTAGVAPPEDDEFGILGGANLQF
ncbi:intraflagellar transport protein 57-like [Tropilaelaps mercedesae]|uniref:Intraflagellar transport protein 57-like n=1 Tax=Tropilaelaps mercedesae TaxID=418985 RepID=A0A1V9X252_9ACAR|nr:intraflagellar transport protein 57-like [Tropilaelaps mercedesae]